MAKIVLKRRCAFIWGLLLLAALLSSTFGSITPVVASHLPSTTIGETRLVEPQIPLFSSLNPDQPIKLEHISLEQGLSQSSVYCILQDSQGILWFGTEDGLNKYDGYSFTHYRNVPGDPHSLSHNHVRTMIEDNEGMLWIGTNGGGLNRFDRATGEFTHYGDESRVENMGSNFIQTIYQDKNGMLWIGTNGSGLNQFDRHEERFVHYFHDPGDPNSLNSDIVHAIFQDQDGRLWIGTDDGMDRFEATTKRFTHYRYDSQNPHSLSNDSVRVIFQDQDGILWIGTDGGGLNQFDPDTGLFTAYQHDPHQLDSLSSNSIRAIFQDEDGTLWIGTFGNGLSIWDSKNPGRFINYQNNINDAHSLSSDNVLSIYQDREGLLWFGTHGGGLNKLDRSTEPFTHYYAQPGDPNSLSSNMIWVIYEDRDGILWIGTGGEGLNRIERLTGEVIRYQHNPDDPFSLHSDVVRAIYEAENGDIWLGTEDGGLNKFDRTTNEFTYYASPQLHDDPVLTLYKDQDNLLWIGTSGSGIYWFDLATEQFVKKNLPDSRCVPGPYIRVIYSDRSGTLWIGDMGSGLSKIDWKKNQCNIYRHNPDDPDSLSDNIVMSVHEDPEGTLWVATFGGGLNKFDRVTEAFTHYREGDGLPNDMVYGILEDDSSSGDRYFWLSTNQGLTRFDPHAGTFKNFDVSDGLQSNEFNGGAYHQSSSGEMFFGGINGFNAFYPNDIQPENTYVPPIVLTYLAQGGEQIILDTSVEVVQEMVVRWPNNFFEFEFAALSYTRPEKNQYAYMLEGLEKDWVYIGNRRFGRYTNLPGGKYVLRLKGSNNDGVWNETGAALTVRVIPPFWAAWWFKGILALMLVGSTICIYWLRVKSLQTRSRELETLVEERTQALKQQTHKSERRRRELEALYSADAELHRLLNLDQVLQTLVDIAVDILQADKSSLMVWNQALERLVVQAARGFRSETLAQMSFTLGRGTVGYVAATGEPVIVEDVYADTHFSQKFPIAAMEGIRSFMLVPIKISGEVFGVFSADYIEPRAFGNDEQRLFVALAQRAALAIDTTQRYEKQQEMVVMEERNRLARDLHDAVTQTLFSASLIAEALPTSWKRDQEAAEQLLDELQLLTRGALAEMRTLLLELRPAALIETDLGDLMRQLAEAATGSEGIPVAVEIDEICKLPSDIHIAFYRIAQEALNNITKHAYANQASMCLRCTPCHPCNADMKKIIVELDIVDDGRGFDPHKVSADRMGLCNMHERAQAIGAMLTITSKVGHGTEVVVVWEGQV